MAKTANNPNAARLLMNWLMTPKGQERPRSVLAVLRAAEHQGAVPLPPRAIPVNPVQANEPKEMLSGLLGPPASWFPDPTGGGDVTLGNSDDQLRGCTRRPTAGPDRR